jgi:putative transposase
MNSDNSQIKSFAHSRGQNWYHLIFVPRGRYPVFRQVHQRELMIEAIHLVCERHSIDLFTYEVMDDHVHLFVSCPPDKSIRRLIQLLKGGTSYHLRRFQPSLKKYPAFWSAGYFYRSVGSVSAETVKHYIDKSNTWSPFKQSKL